MNRAIKAKINLTRALKGVHTRFKAVWPLDASTALALNDLIESNPEFETNQIRSIVREVLSFRPKLMRSNLNLYVASHDDIHAIIQKSEPTQFKKGEDNAGEVFRWLRHFCDDISHEKDQRTLKVVASWERSHYMSLFFKELDEAGVLELVRENPELMERTIEVLNNVPDTGFGYVHKDISLVAELSRSVPALQEGAL